MPLRHPSGACSTTLGAMASSASTQTGVPVATCGQHDSAAAQVGLVPSGPLFQAPSPVRSSTELSLVNTTKWQMVS